MSEESTIRPIYSTRADDPELGGAIEGFVVALAERVDDLQDVEARRDLDQLAVLARRLGRDAERLGFSYLGSCAGVVEASCLADDAEAARKALLEVTDVSQRIRMGHRGSTS